MQDNRKIGVPCADNLFFFSSLFVHFRINNNLIHVKNITYISCDVDISVGSNVFKTVASSPFGLEILMNTLVIMTRLLQGNIIKYE